jgi:hypothetical protein
MDIFTREQFMVKEVTAEEMKAMFVYKNPVNNSNCDVGGRIPPEPVVLDI